MADLQVFYDLEFRFSSGQHVSCTLLEGRDAIEDQPDLVKVTRHNENGSITTLTVHRAKLDAVESTRREEKPQATVTDGGRTRVQHGESIMELS